MQIGGTRTFSLQSDLDLLAEKVQKVGDVRVVIIDPITSYMGSKIDSHRTTDVRAVLEPLAAFAEEFEVAVLAISHRPKQAQTKAINTITGSLGYVAAARIVLIAIEEPGTERRLLLSAKNNLAPLAPGLGYRLAQTIVCERIVASYVVWDNAPVTITANEAVRTAPNGDGDRGSAMTEAKGFLREELADGPKSPEEIKKVAEFYWSVVGNRSPRQKRPQDQVDKIRTSRTGGSGACPNMLNPAPKMLNPNI